MSYSMQVIDHIQNEELDKVEAALDQAIQKDEEDTLYLLADSLFQLGFLEETKRVLNHLLNENPKDDEIRIYLAEIAIEEGEDVVAIDWLDQISPDSPTYIQSLLVAADYYQTQELPEVSESKLLEAKSLMPEEPIILFALGEFYYSVGQYNQAIHHYEETIKQGQDEVAGIQLTARLGTAHSLVGNLSVAADYLNEALEEKEDVDNLFSLGVIYYYMEEYTRVVETMRHLHSLDHTYTSLYPYLASALENNHQLEEAAQAIEEGIRLDKTNSNLYLIGAEIEIKRKDYDQAYAYFESLYDLNPNSETTLIEYGNFLLYMGENNKAIELIKGAIDEDDIDPQFYWILATAYNEEEEFDLARQYFEEAYNYFDENPDFLLDFLDFLQEDGDFDRMKDVGQAYLEIDSANAEVRARLDRLNDDF